MAITTKLAVENYLLTNIDSSFDAQIDEWIASVEAYMNKQTDRILLSDGVSADYYYDVPKGCTNKLRLDEFISISAVTDVDSTEVIAADEIYYYPSNAGYINRIEYDNGFTVGRRKIKVTGIRGRYTEDTLPLDLKFAATVLVAEIINFGNVSVGEVKKETIGRYAVDYATDGQKVDLNRVKDILWSYRRIR